MNVGGEEQTSPRSVYRTAYVAQPDGLPHEDLWVASMLTTATRQTHRTSGTNWVA